MGKIKSLMEERPVLGEVRGHGLMIGLELAGRGSRFTEQPYVAVSGAVNDLYQKIIGWIDQEDYCIMGFSMGGIITFELCRKIEQMGRKLPSGVFFLGVEPPHIKFGTEYHKLDDRKFRQAIKFDFNFYLINGLNDSISRNVLDQWAWHSSFYISKNPVTATFAAIAPPVMCIEDHGFF